MASIVLAVGAWVDVSAYDGSGWVYCRDGVVNVFMGTSNSYDRAVGAGAASEGRPIAIPSGTKWLRADTVSGSPACAYVTDGDQVETVVQALVCGVSPAWGAVLDRGASAGPGVFIMPPLATPDFEVQGSPDNASWFSNGQPVGAPQRANTAWGAFRYFRARAATAISLQVVGFAKAGGPGNPIGPAGGVLAGTYPDPSAVKAFVHDGTVWYVPVDVSNLGGGETAVIAPTPAQAANETDGVKMGLTSQAGGNATAAGAAGNGGDLTVAAANGGDGSATFAGGDGGSVLATAGDSGADAGAGGGNGGDYTIRAGDGDGVTGQGGDFNADAGAGPLNNGDMNLGTNNARIVTVGNPNLATNVFKADAPNVGSYEGPPAVIGAATVLSGFIVQEVSAAAPTVLTSTPTIGAPQTFGQRCTIINTGANNITLQDETALAGSTLRNRGAAPVVLAPFDSVTYVHAGSPGQWYQQ